MPRSGEERVRGVDDGQYASFASSDPFEQDRTPRFEPAYPGAAGEHDHGGSRPVRHRHVEHRPALREGAVLTSHLAAESGRHSLGSRVDAVHLDPLEATLQTTRIELDHGLGQPAS